MIEDYVQVKQERRARAEAARAEIKAERDQNYLKYQAALSAYRGGITLINDKEAALKRAEQAEQTAADNKCGVIYTISNEILAEEGEEFDGNDSLKAVTQRLLMPRITEGFGGLYPNERYKMYVAKKELTIATTTQIVEIAGAAKQRSRHGKPRVLIHPMAMDVEMEAAPRQGIMHGLDENGDPQTSPADIDDANYFLNIVQVFKATPRQH